MCKWALGSSTTNKASGGDGIPVELFHILKDDAMKVLHSICQQIWKTAVATGLEKVSFHFNPKERQCQRMLELLHSTIALISHASKLMLKILQARLQQYMNHELPDVQADFRKSKRATEKHLFLLYRLVETFDCVDHNRLWKILKIIGLPDHLTCLLRNVYAGQEES